MPMVEVRTLGRFEIYVDDQLVSGQIGRSKKLKHLAEYLILNHNRAVPNDEIIEALWPEQDSKKPAQRAQDPGAPPAHDAVRRRRARGYGVYHCPAAHLPLEPGARLHL